MGVGDAEVREGAHVLLAKGMTHSGLKAWGLRVAKRRGHKRDGAAAARRPVIIPHRMWCDGTALRFGRAAANDMMSALWLLLDGGRLNRRVATEQQRDPLRRRKCLVDERTRRARDLSGCVAFYGNPMAPDGLFGRDPHGELCPHSMRDQEHGGRHRPPGRSDRRPAERRRPWVSIDNNRIRGVA